MSGTVKQFVDFSNNTNNDTGENTAASIQPIVNGEAVNETTLQRPDESLRQRTEALRDIEGDALYLRDADRQLVIGGPGKVTWPGSTTALATGIPVLSDVLYVLPMLTPGFAQTAPVPPVASAFGTIHLKRASDSMNSILVTSMRRSYAAGDQISIVVTAGAVFSCTLDTSSGYQRTIRIVATGSTQLSTVITALNGLLPSAPDNTQLVNAALEGGALGTDLLLTSQAKQFMAGNYDGEGHTITPANLAAFFAANPTSALAEGDTLCIEYSMVTDTASTGGRRQALPENSNTAVPVGAFFNSRIGPAKLVNALPICKVINGSLVFSTGIEILAGATVVPLTNGSLGTPIVRNGGFEHGVTGSDDGWNIAHWVSGSISAGQWQLSTTGAASGGKCLELEIFANNGVTASLFQYYEIPVVPGEKILVTAKIRILLATVGNYNLRVAFGDANGNPTLFTYDANTGGVDASYRNVSTTFTVPAGYYSLKYAAIIANNCAYAVSSGIAVRIDDFQVYLPSDTTRTRGTDDQDLTTAALAAMVLEDPSLYTIGQLAALVRFDRMAPSGEGKVVIERRDQVASSTPPALEHQGRILSIGNRILGTAANARLPRISIGASNTHAYTLISEIGASPAARIYRDSAGNVYQTHNASYDGTNWVADITTAPASRVVQVRDGFRMERKDVTTSAWAEAAWTVSFESAPPGVLSNITARPYVAPSFNIPNLLGNNNGVFATPDGRIVYPYRRARYDAVIYDSANTLSFWTTPSGTGSVRMADVDGDAALWFETLASATTFAHARMRGGNGNRPPFPVSTLPGFTIKFRLKNDGVSGTGIGNRYDFMGFSDGGGFGDGTTSAMLYVERDATADVATPFRVRYIDSSNANFTNNTTFNPVANVWYYMTLIVLSQNPGSFLFRIGTTPNWKQGDSMYYSGTLAGTGILQPDNNGFNWRFAMGTKTRNATMQRLDLEWVEVFSTKEYA